MSTGAPTPVLDPALDSVESVVDAAPRRAGRRATESARKARIGSINYAVRAPLLRWLEAEGKLAAEQPRRIPGARRRLRDEAVPAVLRAGRGLRRRRSVGPGRPRRHRRGHPGRRRHVRRRPLQPGARAHSRPGEGRPGAPARGRPGRARPALDARRAGVPPLAAGSLALDACRARAALPGERGVVVGDGDAGVGACVLHRDADGDLRRPRCSSGCTSASSHGRSSRC